MPRSLQPGNPTPDGSSTARFGPPSASAPRSGTPRRCGSRRRSSATTRPGEGLVRHGCSWARPPQGPQTATRRDTRPTRWHKRSRPWNPRRSNPAPRCSGVPRHPLDTGLQARPVEFAAAERPPVGKQAFHDLQAHPSDCVSGPSSIDQLLKVALEVSPTDLPQFQGQLAISRPAVATDDAGDRLAQEGLKARKTPPEVDHEQGRRRRRRRPQPAPLACFTPAGLVGVLHRRVPDFLLDLLICAGQGGTGLGFQGDHGPQRDRHLEDGLDDLFDGSTAQMMPSGEVRHHRSQPRRDDMGTDLGGDLPPIEMATAGAGARACLVLGDDGHQRGQFCDLVPGRLRIARCGSLGQGGLASGADRWHIGDDLLHPVRRSRWRCEPGCPVARPVSATGGLDDRLGGPRWIGRRGRGGVGGVAVELAAEFVEFGLQLGDLLLGEFQRGQLSTVRTAVPGLAGRSLITLITIRPAATIA